MPERPPGSARRAARHRGQRRGRLYGAHLACAAAKQSDNAAERIQTTTLRQQRLESDLRELRAVLDDASVDLDLLYIHLRRVAYRWLGGNKPVSASTRALLNRSNRAALAGYQRLRIRLPAGSPVTKSYADTRGEAEALAFSLYNSSPSSASAAEVECRLRAMAQKYDRFITAAYREVHSEIR